MPLCSIRKIMQNPQAGWSEAMGAQSDMPNGDADLRLHPRQPLPPGLVRALGWLKDRLDEPIQLDTLAAVAGVRPRTLEANFRRYLRTTPLGWVRQMRLARARQQLLAAKTARAKSDATDEIVDETLRLSWRARLGVHGGAGAV